MWRGLAAGLLALLLAPQPSAAGEPPQRPFLRIEAGGHTGTIAHLAVDAAGHLLASASYDKTIRLWSLPDGVERAVLRPPIGTAEAGEIYAVALTPDGKRLFAAGATGGQWDGSFCVYVFDTAKAALAFLLPGLPAPVNDLAVSADGARFAAGLAAGGVRVWDAATGKPLFADRDYRGPVRALAFDRHGRLFSTAADGQVRGYAPDGTRFAAAATPAGLPPWGLAVSPDGDLLAVTSATADRDGRLHLDILSAATLAPVAAPDTAGLHGEGLLTASWAADGRGGVQLLAAGYAHDARGYVVRRWADFGFGGFTDLPAAHDTIRHLIALPGGGAAYAAEDPGWGRIDGAGRVAARPSPPLLDLRPARGHLAVAADGGSVEFASSAGRLRFVLASRTLAPAEGAALPLSPPPGERLADWRDSSAPLLDGRRLQLDRDEFSRSAAMLPDGGVLLGTDTHLRRFDAHGAALGAVETPAAAWAIGVAAGGEVAVAALLDGTLRWYGLTPHLHERAALFAHADGVRWVLFTPGGLFDDADRGGSELVGVHLNRARNQQPDWVSFARAYRVLFAPDAVRAAVLGDGAAASARLAELGDLRARFARQPEAQVAGVCVVQEDGACAPVPLARGIAAALPASAAGLRLTVALRERGLGIGPIDVFVNGRNTGRIAGPPSGGEIALPVTLDAGDNVVQVRVYDQDGSIYSETAPLDVVRTASGPADAQGRLFVLAIGIDRFANPAFTLRYAVADAQAVADGLRAEAPAIYASPDVTVLLDGQATRAGILGALRRLAQAVRPRDTFLLYIASHGVIDTAGNRFILVPSDASDASSFAALAAQSIDDSTLIAALAQIGARDALLMLDTCHAGSLSTDSLANVGHATGRYLLAATESVQEALDSYDQHNGVFVYALREALAGRAGADAGGDLGALTLGGYVSRRVSELAQRRHFSQDAVFRAAQRDLRSFPVAHVVATPPAP